ncbi:MAG: ShlB/FhaC/HecB family hemolysin secretion/activation protein [Opitutaceae bacterium]|nr:ShlB/FhaC/HecB family hemolysin secretion/activation protein [Opitutaceae bacterium]
MLLRSLRHHRPITLAAARGALGLLLSVPLGAQPAETDAQPAAVAVAASRRLFIREYRVEGATALPRLEVERAVYPFLGPARTLEDVDKACEALMKAYHAKGFQLAVVTVPEDQPRTQVEAGIIRLQVHERTVGRLRVTGARFSSPEALKAQVPSLAEGRQPDYDRLRSDFERMPSVPGREIKLGMGLGVEPETFDIELQVKERLPLTAGVELNNRYSADTTRLRLNGSLGLNNLWQAGHTVGLSYQTAPQEPSEVEVFSGYYLLPMPGWKGASLLLQGTKQNSDVSTLGNVAVTSRGTTLGWRMIQSLPAPEHPEEEDEQERRFAAGEAIRRIRFYHSLSYGFDYKRTAQRLELPPRDPDGEGAEAKPTIFYTPVTHYPLSATYSATWWGERRYPAAKALAAGSGAPEADEPRVVRLWTTELNAGATLHLRGLGSSPAAFNESRDDSDGGYFYFRTDLTQTVRLPWDFQAQGKLQGQLADRPLLSAEQSSGGGLGTVRGYLEAEASGDDAAFASLELRSPSLLSGTRREWRFHAFGDWGWLGTKDPSAEEISRRWLLSVGAGTRLTLGKYFTGSLDVGVPLHDGPRTETGDVQVTFRAGLDY